jgi:hypothetical protein
MGIADLLNETWSYINERAKKSSDAARAATGITDSDGVLDIARKTANAEIVPESQRQAGIILPETAATFAAAPTGLYSLADAALQWASGGNKGIKLPGADAAAQITKDIQTPVREVSSAIVGKPVDDNLLSGTQNDLVSSWTRLGFAAGATVNPTALAAIPGASKLAAGIEELGSLGRGALTTLEVLSPAVISKNPTPLLIGANTAVAAGISTGLEALIGDAKTGTEAKQKIDSFAAGAQDTAMQGVEEAKTVHPVLAGSSTPGALSWSDVAAAGVVTAGIFGFYKRDLAYRAITGLKQGETTTSSLGTVLKEQIGDAGAPIHEAWKKQLKSVNMKDANDVADATKTRMDQRSGSSIDTQLQQTYEFGDLPNSNVKIPPINDLMTGYRAATPEQQAAAVARINARHEIDTRQLNANKTMNLGSPIGQQGDSLFQGVTRMKGWDDTKVAYHMDDVSTSDLYKRWNDRSDPVVTALSDSYFAALRKMPDYLYEQRSIMKHEANLLYKQNPNYAATKLADGRSHLGSRHPDPGTGLRDPGNPFEELPKYVDEMVRFTEANKTRREILGAMIRYKDAGDPFAAKMIGRVDKKLHESTSAGDLNVRFRDVDGRPRDVEILDPVFRRAMQNIGRPAGLTLISGRNKFLGGMARAFENAAVGPLAAVAGTVFAPVGTAYSVLAGSVFRDKNLGAAGRLDKWMLGLTNNKFGVRGDPTFAAEVAFRAAQNVGAVLTQRAAKVLRDQILKGNIDGSTKLGPHTAQVWADLASNKFKASGIADLQRRGQLGPASVMTIDPSKRFADAAKMLKGQNPLEKANGLVSDILHAISSAPATTLYAVNRGRPKIDQWKTDKLAREFSGDPTRSGSFTSPVGKAVGYLTSSIPWGNIYIQANAKLIGSFRRDPIGTSAGVFNLVAVPTVLSMVQIIRAEDWVDPKTGEKRNYADYAYNVRSPDRQAMYLYVPILGRPPEQGLELPLDPVMRLFKHGVEVLAGQALGLFDKTIFKEENRSLKTAIQALGGERYTNLNPLKEGSQAASLLNQSVLPPTPPLLGAATAVTGLGKTRGWTDYQALPKKTTDGFEDKHKSAWAEEAMASIAADTGRFIYGVLADAAQAHGEGKSTGQILDQVGKRYSQKLGDSTKYISGPLFESFQAISPSTETAALQAKGKLDAIKKLTQAYNDTTDRGGSVGNFIGSPKRGYTEGLGKAPAPAVDQNMLHLAELVVKFAPQLEQEFLGKNKDLFALRSQVQNSSEYTPQAKRAIMNGYAEQIVDNNRELVNRIDMIERNLSLQFGVQIKLDKIDPRKGMQQFKPLNRPAVPVR